MGYINYIYIDESGDLGLHGTKYFTIGAVMADSPIELSRIIKRLRRKKLKKSIRQLGEIKANNSTQRIREFVLNDIKKANCTIFAIVVKKDKILTHLLKTKNRLYNYLCGLLIKKMPFENKKLLITIDKKQGNTLLEEDFNQYITQKIKEKNKDIKVEITHKDSKTSNELQVVDFIVWSINRKFSFDDDTYYKIIEKKISNNNEIEIW